MSIEWQHKHTCPQIRCDHCGDIVAEGGKANALWRADYPAGSAPMPQPVVFVHHDCIAAFEAATTPYAWLGMVLDVYLVYLEHNLKLNRPLAEEFADVLESIP